MGRRLSNNYLVHFKHDFAITRNNGSFSLYGLQTIEKGPVVEFSLYINNEIACQ